MIIQFCAAYALCAYGLAKAAICFANTRLYFSAYIKKYSDVKKNVTTPFSLASLL